MVQYLSFLNLEPQHARILEMTFFQNTIEQYLLAFLAFLFISWLLKFFEHRIAVKLRSGAEWTEAEIDDIIVRRIDNIGWVFYMILSLYISLRFLTTPAIIDTGSYFLLLVAITYYGAQIVQDLIDYGIKKIIKKEKQEREQEGVEEFDPHILEFLNKIAQWAVWLVAIILILGNLGYNVSALIAGLGIGGIAIAFALQNVLADVFASFSIYFDKPFQKGDFVITEGDAGVVKKVGIKTTRIQTLQGEELVVSNQQLTSTRIHNYGKMESRRIVFGFGVTYETPNEKLEKIPSMVKEIIESKDLTEVDRIHFKEFGDSALVYETVYYVQSSEYGKYMDLQEEINLEIKKRFEEEGIGMAYPTRTLFVNQVT